MNLNISWRWVSVKKELPKCSGTPVLVFNPTGTERKVFEAYYGRSITGTPNFYLYGALLPDVTHWRALPEAPK